VPGRRTGRAPARPCAVHGLRPGRGAPDRPGAHRRERRLGFDRRRADRAQGVRLLAQPPRPHRPARPRGGGCRAGGRRAVKRLLYYAARVLTAFDWPLLLILLLLAALGLTVMHSAVGGTDWRFADQARNFLIAFVVLWAVAL